MGATEINAFELDRLDLFATQTLMKCLLNHILTTSPDPERTARELAQLYEGSIRVFDLRGADQHKSLAAREYLLNAGQQMISDSANAKPA